MENNADKYKKKIITIPNILSFFRIVLIPLILWLYIVKQDYLMTGVVVLISGLTDIVDGFIARRFNMISDVGKVLDPVADKATQLVVMIVISISFPLMLLPIITLIVKEIFMAITGYMVIRKCDVVMGAEWHGKAATVLLTANMILHLIWYDIPPVVSMIVIGLSTALIILSFVLYAKRNFGYLLKK